MLRTGLWTLRQPRYAALAALMLVIAVLCVIAGTWQVSRFEQSVHDNHALSRNAHASAVPLATALVPLAGDHPAPGRDAIRYRTVTTSGTYLAGTQFVRDQSVNGVSGYYVLTPVRTDAGVVLVVRGFAAQTGQGTPPAVPAAPAGAVTVTGRLQTPDSKNDGGQPGNAVLASINPKQQAVRLGAPVYDAYLTLAPGQPGSAGLTALPAPDLSNPAGGAVEPQHFAYIIQWYLFALLALAAPFAIARNEVRDAQRRFLGLDTGEQELGLETGAPRTDQPQLTAGGDGSTGAALARRSDGELARPGAPTTQQWRRAARLADRYGRSLGLNQPDFATEPEIDERPDRAHRAPAGAPVLQSERLREADVVSDSASDVHRSPDAYHGAYNDYLWRLALADGAVPDVTLPPAETTEPPDPIARDGRS